MHTHSSPSRGFLAWIQLRFSLDCISIDHMQPKGTCSCLPAMSSIDTPRVLNTPLECVIIALPGVKLPMSYMMLDIDHIRSSMEIKTFHCEGSYWIAHSVCWIQKTGSRHRERSQKKQISDSAVWLWTDDLLLYFPNFSLHLMVNSCLVPKYYNWGIVNKV